MIDPRRDDSDDPDDPDGRDGPSPGSLLPTSLFTLLGWAVVGVGLGWVVHPLANRWGIVPPLVSFAQPLALALLAAILAYVAWSTHRTIHVHKERLETHQAVNRLVIARASALVAALVAGGYLGYALSWIGDSAQLADERMVRSLLAAGAALLAAMAALVLERSCRVRGDD